MYNPSNTVRAILEDILNNDNYKIFPILADALEDDNFIENYTGKRFTSKFILEHLRDYKECCLSYADYKKYYIKMNCDAINVLKPYITNNY